MRIKPIALSFTLALTFLFGLFGVLDVEAKVIVTSDLSLPSANELVTAKIIPPQQITPTYYLVPMEESDIDTFILHDGAGTHNCIYFENGLGITVSCNGTTDTFIAHSRYVGGVKFFGSDEPHCAETVGVYGTLSSSPLDNGSGPNVSEFTLNRTVGIGWTEVPSEQTICTLLLGADNAGAGAVVGCDNVWRTGSGKWHHLVNLYAGGAQIGGDDQPYSFLVENLSWIVEPGSDCPYAPPPPPPSPKDLPFAPVCVFTHTQIITNDLGITETVQTQYTRESNLLSNSSFEQGNLIPDEWDSVIGGVLTDVLDYYSKAEGQQNQGQDAVFNSEPFFLIQDYWLRSGGSYMLGGFVRGAPNVTMRHNSYVGPPVAQTTINQAEYELITGTFGTGGGSPFFTIEFTQTGSNTWVDDVFVIPVISGTNQLNCDPDFYPEFVPSEAPDDTVPGPISPIPIGGAGTVCYLCTSPPSANPNFVSHWIAWLGCVLRNMFSCSLRVWLLVIGNWLKGLVEMGIAWIIWIPNLGQSVVDWLVTIANDGLSFVVNSVETGADWLKTVLAGIGGTVEAGTNFWDFLIALLALIGSFLQLLSGLLLGIIDLLLGIIEIIPSAFEAEAILLEINGVAVHDPLDLVSPGPTTGKMLWFIIVPMRVIDQFVISEFSEILVIGIGALSLGTLIWSVKWWQDFEI